VAEAAGKEAGSRLWPVQTTPKAIVRVNSRSFAQDPAPAGSAAYGLGANLGPDHMLLQSLMGLGAAAVNRGELDELIYLMLWDNQDYTAWHRRLMARTQLEDRGESDTWSILKRYATRGIVKGYILYRRDASQRGLSLASADMDESANVAASAAGIMRAVLICEEQEARAKALGLRRLLDAREKDDTWTLENLKKDASRRHLLVQDPAIPNNRAIAIAHNILTVFGVDAPTEAAYRWMEPPGLVFGWNDAHSEGGAISQASKCGHATAASNWALNMPALSAGAADFAWPRLRDVRTVQPARGKRRVSMILSDGDNLQWLLGGFAFNRHYWAAALNGEIPFGFGLPLCDLMETCPDPYLLIRETQPRLTGATLAQTYFFPDEMGINLTNEERLKVLRFHGRRIERTLKASGLSTMICLTQKLDCDETREALRVMGSQAPSLRAIYGIQYHPYTAGKGASWRLDTGDGRHVTLISVAYALWANLEGPRVGTPSQLAKKMNAAPDDGQPVCVIVHAWSGFRELAKPGVEESAPYDSAGSFSGVATAGWLLKYLGDGWEAITPAQMPAAQAVESP